MKAAGLLLAMAAALAAQSSATTWSVTNDLSEAFSLARADVVSIVPDSPAHRGTPAAETQTEVVADERRILDWLLSEPGIDPARLAYVGRFILLGAVPLETAPDRYLPKSRAPILVQCARLATDANVRGCPKIYRLAGAPKRLVWYDDDHYFTSLEAMRDRLAWLERYLKLKPIQPQIEEFLKPPPWSKLFSLPCRLSSRHAPGAQAHES